MSDKFKHRQQRFPKHKKNDYERPKNGKRGRHAPKERFDEEYYPPAKGRWEVPV